MAGMDMTGAPGGPHGLAQPQLGHTPAHGHCSLLQLSPAHPGFSLSSEEALHFIIPFLQPGICLLPPAELWWTLDPVCVSVCVEVLMEAGPSPAALPPWVRIIPSWICCSPTVSCCSLGGAEGRAVCEPHHRAGIDLGKGLEGPRH